MGTFKAQLSVQDITCYCVYYVPPTLDGQGDLCRVTRSVNRQQKRFCYLPRCHRASGRWLCARCVIPEAHALSLGALRAALGIPRASGQPGLPLTARLRLSKIGVGVPPNTGKHPHPGRYSWGLRDMVTESLWPRKH